MNHPPSPRGALTATLIYDVLRLHGRLIAAGDALMADLGLTSARWQVLGTIAASRRSPTVSSLARLLGQSRQSIQRLANELGDQGLVGFIENPEHKRAMLLVLTDRGRQLHGLVEARRIPWTEGIAAGMDGLDLAQAIEALSRLRAILERE